MSNQDDWAMKAAWELRSNFHPPGYGVPSMQPEDMAGIIRRHAAAELAKLREDRDRLDWLEGEFDREHTAITQGGQVPHSLFRMNIAITRTLIDAARKAQP